MGVCGGVPRVEYTLTEPGRSLRPPFWLSQRNGDAIPEKNPLMPPRPALEQNLRKGMGCNGFFFFLRKGQREISAVLRMISRVFPSTELSDGVLSSFNVDPVGN